MKLSILLCLCLLAQGVFPHMPTVYEFCSHVVANGEGGRATCDASQCQGRPGKIGPIGPRGIQGLKGQKGENGTSEGLEEKVRILEETVCYMGMKSGQIPDSAITASSYYDANHAAHLGRLDNQPSGSNGGTWVSRNNNVGQWIQVDLGQPEVVAGVVTQGRLGYYNQWVTSYKVSYGNVASSMATITEHRQDKVFSANTDKDTKFVNKFPQLMTCRYIRIYPQTYYIWMSMRLEIIRGICKDIY